MYMDDFFDKVKKLSHKQSKEIAFLCGVVAVLLLVTVGVFFGYRGSFHTGTSGSMPANPAIFGTLEATTTNSVTVKLQDGSQKTFSVSSATQVVTQVQSGEVGKSLDEITVGTMVLVQPHVLNSLVADSLDVLPPP